MKKDFIESRLEVILLDAANIICTSGCAYPVLNADTDELEEMSV